MFKKLIENGLSALAMPIKMDKIYVNACLRFFLLTAVVFFLFSLLFFLVYFGRFHCETGNDLNISFIQFVPHGISLGNFQFPLNT